MTNLTHTPPLNVVSMWMNIVSDLQERLKTFFSWSTTLIRELGVITCMLVLFVLVFLFHTNLCLVIFEETEEKNCQFSLIT